MALRVASLASGSNGNCYYIGNNSEAVLVDAGISCREVEKRMQRQGLSMNLIKAIFISHEHKDHTTGVPVLAKKYNLPVYISHNTFLHSRLPVDKDQVIHFSSTTPVSIGGLTVNSFSKIHDAADPYSFVVSCNGIKAGVFTDIGAACSEVKKYFSQCHAAFLEANYDADMLKRGSYPYHLKRRICGGKGHLSNDQALELFLTCRPQFMSHLFLSHLSKHNNDPALVQQLFGSSCSKTSFIVASRERETSLYHIPSEVAKVISKKVTEVRQLALELF